MNENDYFGVVPQDSHHLAAPGSSGRWSEITAHFILSIKQPPGNNDFNSACTEFELALQARKVSCLIRSFMCYQVPAGSYF